MMENVVATLSRASELSRTARFELVDAVEELRVFIIELQSRRHALVRTNVDYETALARLDLWIDGNRSPDSFIGELLGRHPSTKIYRSPVTTLGAAIDMMFVNELREKLKSEIRSWCESHPGLSDQDLNRQLADIDVQMLDAEMAEEGLIRAAENAGINILRRKDANPLAVLAHDSALP